MAQFGDVVQGLRATFNTGRTARLEWRLEQLSRLRTAVLGHEAEIVEALTADLRRPRAETVIGEVASIVGELDFILANLSKWVKPEAVSHPLAQKPGHSKVYRVPKGVVLVISPWNYPFNNVLIPVAAVLAAGNCCLVKPSELSPESARLLQKVLSCLDQEAVRVVQGAAEETTALLKLQFDHIMYTGNSTVGRIVMRAAAEHLTPVTLELGGKSPVIVDDSVNVKTMAKRLCWGKFMNAGQTCIAPDYMLVTAGVKDRVVAAVKETIQDFYGREPYNSPDLARIVNARHWDRIQGLLEDHYGAAWTADISKRADKGERFIPPTVVVDPRPDSRLMQEEIFGPVLPILTVGSIEEAIDFVNKRERPLALYVFSESSATVDRVLAGTTSGGTCVNDVIYQIANPYLPFGGVGASGHGAYHGRAGFEEFSHHRAVMWRPTWLDLKQRYPPYDEASVAFVMKLLVGPLIPPKVKRTLLVALLVALGACAVGLSALLR